jgi:hypothetical protein
MNPAPTLLRSRVTGPAVRGAPEPTERHLSLVAEKREDDASPLDWALAPRGMRAAARTTGYSSLANPTSL